MTSLIPKLIFAAVFLITTGVVFANDDDVIQVPDGWKLVWQDDFDSEDGRPNPENWGYRNGFLGYNEELQTYTDRLKNSRIEDGILVIEAHREDLGDEAQYTSARLITKGKREFTHGRIEVKARFTTGRGTWPAIWLLGANVSEIGWPACGEIDIMEHLGSEPNVLHFSVHSEKYNHKNGNHFTDWIKVPDVKNTWHIYGVEWDSKRIRFLFDNIVVAELKREKGADHPWPFDNPMYLILNIAVGGTMGGKKGVDDSSFPEQMYVDWVRYYRSTQEG